MAVKASPKTYRTYSDLVTQHVVPALGRITLSKLTAPAIQRFLNAKLESGLSPKTVWHLRTVLRSALNVAVKWGLISWNPVSATSPPRLQRKEPEVFTVEQARTFLEAVSGHRWEALYTVALTLGLRQGEILGLTWDCIDFENRLLHVRHQLQRVNGKPQLVPLKTASSRRTLAIPGVLFSKLMAHQQRQELEKAVAGRRWQNELNLVFTTSRGTPIHQRNLLRDYYAILKKAGLPRIPFHNLRHSAATLLLLQGVHPRTVMELLGHSQIAVTMDTYAHVIEQAKREAAEKMDRLFASEESAQMVTGLVTGPRKERLQ